MNLHNFSRSFSQYNPQICSPGKVQTNQDPTGLIPHNVIVHSGLYTTAEDTLSGIQHGTKFSYFRLDIRAILYMVPPDISLCLTGCAISFRAPSSAHSHWPGYPTTYANLPGTLDCLPIFRRVLNNNPNSISIVVTLQ